MTALGERFEQALVYAARLHAAQVRKGTEVPYVSHLLAVASLVLDDGGDEDEAIAALLHDAVEDQGGAARLEDIRRRFGSRVADIVEGCSDTDAAPKPPWRGRKEAYIARLSTASPSVVRVSLADKVHNARAIVRDFRLVGDALWSRFDPDADHAWYYRALVDAFARVSSSPMVDELHAATVELEEAVGGGPAV